MRCTVVSTTGVSSTTVASRVSTAVTTAASTTTSTSSRRGRAAAGERGPGAEVVEDAGLGAQVPEHEDARRGTPTVGPISFSRSSASCAGDDAGADDEHGAGNRDDGLAQPERTGYRDDEAEDEDRDRDGLRERARHAREATHAIGVG